ncbi:MAG: chloride channel protein [Gemmatimonadetes bacterium]|nr:MAG: chloride channel protein [Gemmatimonadota bacterium]
MSRPAAFDNELGDFTADVRILTLTAMAALIGVISAFVALALLRLIGFFTHLFYYHAIDSSLISPAGNRLGLWALLVPIIGGLIVGLMARYGSERIRGHGIPEALEAILIGQSRMSARVAVLKPLSSAIAIGTGGPFGAEGPIIMTGGAFGSLFGQAFHLSPAERKTLLVAGAAGGMAAVFGTPLAAALLAVELLLFEWKPRSFVPVACAAAVAAAVRVPLLGPGPLFPVPPHATLAIRELVIALALGITAGFGSGLLTRLVYVCEDLFRKVPIHWMWWPILGGAVIGLGGLLSPRALGVGYDTIHDLLTGRLVGVALLGLMVTKAVIWAVALGSGTSGGVLAPLLIMGGALGALEAHWIPAGDTGLWAALSMGAIMGGTMRAPFTAVAFMVELTHDVNVLPGLLVACVAADAVTVLLMKRSILTEKVARRGYHLTREYSANPLHLLRVQDVMEPPVLQVGDRSPAVSYPDELLDHALTKMLEHEVDLLPVVDRGEPEQVVGYVARDGILAAWVQFARDEGRREPGWLAAQFRKVRAARRPSGSPPP